ncbi:hypothetical protein Tco_0941865 [Tanacetum coccineum]|uniref:Uncharacterized protein n=1 Tax=Tanacetum coccineum TaxID=301880 RepID=A0ABQ5DS27_9ASTR
MLTAAGVQIPRNNLDDCINQSEEDGFGTSKIWIPKDLLGSFLLADTDLRTLDLLTRTLVLDFLGCVAKPLLSPIILLPSIRFPGTIKVIEQPMARSGTDLKMAKLLSFKLYISRFWDLLYFFPPEDISPPKDTETPVESPIPVSPSSSVGSSSPVRSTTPPPDYPFDESIFAELDNSLWIIPRPLGSEPVPKEPDESDTCYNVHLWK